MAISEYKDTSLSVEEQEYLLKHPLCNKLTQGLDRDALWDTLNGAMTILQAIETEARHSEYNKRENERERLMPKYTLDDCSWEMALRNEWMRENTLW